MKRRELLKQGATGIALAAVTKSLFAGQSPIDVQKAPLPPEALIGEEPYGDHRRVWIPRNYRGWEYRWTGWKGGQDTTCLCGQWIGSRMKNREADPVIGKYGPLLLCSPAPGPVQWYYRGAQFDVSAQKGQTLPVVEMLISPDGRAKLNAARDAAEVALQREIDHYILTGKPGARHPQEL